MDKRLKIAKAIVFIFTSLIIIGTLFLFRTIAKQEAESSIIKFSNINLEQPVGSEIQSFKIKDKDLYIHIKNGLDNEKLLLVDIPSGKIKTEISLH